MRVHEERAARSGAWRGDVPRWPDPGAMDAATARRGALPSPPPASRYTDFALSLCLLVLMLGGLILSVALALWAHDVAHAYRDVTLLARVQSYATPALTRLMHAVSFLGDIPAIVLTVGALALALFARRRPIQAATLLMAVGGGALVAAAFKPLVGRLGPGATTPPDGLLAFNHYAFPSGHAVYFTTCLLPLAWFIWEWRPRAATAGAALLAGMARVALCALLLGLVALGGLSQVYLGYHWPSDVAGGYAIGGFWSALVLLVYLRFRHLERRAGG